jgi:hypothetical protein
VIVPELFNGALVADLRNILATTFVPEVADPGRGAETPPGNHTAGHMSCCHPARGRDKGQL